MMHKSNLVFCVKASGKVLREHGEAVYIPFGSEYTLYIKNLNSVRCQVKIDIDGKSISGGSEFIINANSSIEIERSIVDGNLNAGNKFKFIERTASIEKHRGVGAEDGLIRIEYEFERQPTAITNTFWNGYPIGGTPYYPPGVRGTGTGLPNDREIWCSTKLGSLSQYSASASAASLSDTSEVPYKSLRSNATPQTLNQVHDTYQFNDAGITVAGSKSDQKFQTVSAINSDGVKHVMTVQLRGESNSVPITKPITVKQKPTCPTCGKLNKATAKYCSECGTSLEVFA